MQVRKKSDGTILAMKILKKRAIIARNQVEHTRAERKILQSLQHPFLMTLRYAFQSKEKLYFVLDYYQVRPSTACLASALPAYPGRMSTPMAASVAAQLCGRAQAQLQQLAHVGWARLVDGVAAS